ncbi:hypothetical protein GCM10010140_69780 [Streptosporangium pseudovulgare]|uniref:Uncharacterized protein n=1 Tax=Streptosporangium pseudovulgare TaxID=35765 RepID=A0ABQ2RGE5_9ACTN|nr:hypothetical protein GCM10010140_69780 [Streptosporangium pseudovulgare]
MAFSLLSRGAIPSDGADAPPGVSRARRVVGRAGQTARVTCPDPPEPARGARGGAGARSPACRRGYGSATP